MVLITAGVAGHFGKKVPTLNRYKIPEDSRRIAQKTKEKEEA